MSTESQPDRELESPPRPTRHPVLTPFVVVAALLDVVVALLFVLAVTELDGNPIWSDGPLVPVGLVVVVLPGLLIAWAAKLVEDLVGRRRPSYALLSSVSVLLMLGAVGAAAFAGVQAHERNQQVIAVACSTQDVAVLDSVARYGLEYSGARGNVDGFCSASIMVRGDDPGIAMAMLSEQLRSEGWMLTTTGWPSTTVTREGSTVVIEHVQSSEGTTGISLTVLE